MNEYDFTVYAAGSSAWISAVIVLSVRQFYSLKLKNTVNAAILLWFFIGGIFMYV